MANNVNNELVFDPKKLKEMVARIYEAERRNTRTENKSDKAMKGCENITWFRSV